MEDNSFINILIREKEGEQMAFFSDIDIEKIAQVVCAFLNTKGGRILIGFDEKKKPVIKIGEKIKSADIIRTGVL